MTREDRLHVGKPLRITCNGRTLDAHVVIASPNLRSLIVAYDGVLDGFIGTMATFTEENGTTRNLMTGTAVVIEWKDGDACSSSN